MPKLSPDTPKSGFILFVRFVIRKLRIILHFFCLRGKLKIGNNVSFGPANKFMIPEFMRLGCNFSSGRNLFIQTNVEIGNDCLISSDVSFLGHDHKFNDPNHSAYWSGRELPSTVILEGNNFIGYRATIIGNIVVSEGAIVAAGAVVVKNVKPYSVVAGVPAKHIKFRFD